MDRHDASCTHLLVEPAGGGPLLGGCRLRLFRDGDEAARTAYAADYHDLSAMDWAEGPLLELGRVCVRPEAGPGLMAQAEVLRAMWMVLAALVESRGVAALFGCASFPGARPDCHAAALAWLFRRHALPAPRGPARRPDRKAVGMADLPPVQPSPAGVPPLLRSYLGMGGRASDHAVIDRDLDTLVVFTRVEVAAVPARRLRRLRAAAAALSRSGGALADRPPRN